MIIIRSLFVVLLPLLVWSTTAFGAGRIIVIEVDGVINPVVAEFMANEIYNANKFSEELIVIQMDTPGGLDPSMRKIIKAIQNSKVPVASFISPGGSRAASAGVFIAIASHISAMEPGTKIGAAH
ncbi:MAG: nodulation protein NfeD, partial [Nitrospina sp.]|nr:nodulation protein NfeD [Nitrospina sp.]